MTDTEHLIAALASSPERPQPVAAIFTRRLAAGVLAAILLTFLVLGFRPDAFTAAGMAVCWPKLIYTLVLAVTGFVVLERLGRPGTVVGKRALLIAVPLVVMGLGALLQWQSADASLRPLLLWGRSWLVCPYLIVFISAPVFAATILAMRRLAPTNPVAAGAAAGFFAGAAGATVYGFHCGETAMVFVSIWYSLGIAAMTLIGAATGRWLLRW
ncbi:hypothetical protein FHS83_001012 [Rhizomicrobium palustre]|jgi:hypothetical protein|uniref:DUF1109 family protein n=1 Tax=Rhizomicrobium palustre TaxID=189966 RepID=A0A846MW08_9PROT|nr:DUF1109 domain-containing protein [Rhizomicrobium palustre]NIK87694.1 hypothetical protein [Rhizomicrobium palustre]